MSTRLVNSSLNKILTAPEISPAPKSTAAAAARGVLSEKAQVASQPTAGADRLTYQRINDCLETAIDCQFQNHPLKKVLLHFLQQAIAASQKRGEPPRIALNHYILYLRQNPDLTNYPDQQQSLIQAAEQLLNGADNDTILAPLQHRIQRLSVSTSLPLDPQPIPRLSHSSNNPPPREQELQLERISSTSFSSALNLVRNNNYDLNLVHAFLNKKSSHAKSDEAWEMKKMLFTEVCKKAAFTIDTYNLFIKQAHFMHDFDAAYRAFEAIPPQSRTTTTYYNFMRAAMIAPQHPESIVENIFLTAQQDGKADGEIHAAYIEAMGKLGHFDRALSHFQTLRDTSPELLTPRGYANFMSAAKSAAENEKDPVKKEAFFALAWQAFKDYNLSPNSFIYTIALAVACKREQKDFAAAQDIFDTAMTLPMTDENRNVLLNTWINCLAENGREQQAEELFLSNPPVYKTGSDNGLQTIDLHTLFYAPGYFAVKKMLASNEHASFKVITGQGYAKWGNRFQYRNFIEEKIRDNHSEQWECSRDRYNDGCLIIRKKAANAQSWRAQPPLHRNEPPAAYVPLNRRPKQETPQSAPLYRKTPPDNIGPHPKPSSGPTPRKKESESSDWRADRKKEEIPDPKPPAGRSQNKRW